MLNLPYKEDGVSPEKNKISIYFGNSDAQTTLKPRIRVDKNSNGSKQLIGVYEDRLEEKQQPLLFL